MKDGPLSLTSLDVQNILRLKAVRLTLDPGGVLIIEGKNEAGKSSVLRSLEMLLSGGKETPDAPIHGDATKGHIIATFGDIVVKKVFRKGKRPVLTITTADGARMQAPQTMLDKLLSHVSLDPVSFMNKSDREKTVILSDLMGFDSKEFDAEIERLYNLRRDANREAARLAAVADATTFHEDAPDEEVSVSALMTELQKRQAHNATRAEAAALVVDGSRLVAEARDAIEHVGQMIRSVDLAITTLEQELADKRLERENGIRARADAGAKLANHQGTVSELKAAQEAIVPANEDEITAKIAAADDINRQVRDNVERETARHAVDIADVNRRQADTELKAETDRREKARMEARKNLPIPDLDITADAVLYRGKPLSQAGGSAELRVSVAVAIALNKDKRVKLLLIDDAEKLDSDNVKVVMEMAREAEFQVIMCRVGDGKTASVVIEDGEIKA
ncbi:MAG: AAA family ATPase [Candidatus Hydrogenedentes bacterium]|nr:AAA family ATPase [Candidatus Hydrogenedentota bacterium]